MATYDPTLREVVLYGGVGQLGQTGDSDLWAFNGTSWRLMNLSAPPGPRYGGVFAFDTALGGDVLFGGVNGSGGSDAPTNSTWLLRNGIWSNLTGLIGLAPPAASGIGGAYDPASGSLVLFGGGTLTGYLNTTWSFNGSTWQLLAENQTPSARWFGQVVYDSKDSALLLFGGSGGQGGSTVFNDTWTFVSGAWTQVAASKNANPVGVSQAVLAADSTGGAVLFGGNDGTGLINDTWMYQSGNWTELLPPTGSASLAATFELAQDTATNSTYLFGPQFGSLEGQTWEFFSGAWTKLNLSVEPPALAFASLDYDPTINCLILFGGQEASPPSRASNSTWTFCNGTWVELPNQLAPIPAARWGGQFGFDPAEGGDILFGGSNGIVNFTDTWLFANSSWRLLPQSTHPGEGGWGQEMAMSYDPAVGGMVWLGASGWNIFRTEMWIFSNGSWTNDTAVLPPKLVPVDGTALAYDPARGALFAFGGQCYQACNETMDSPYGVGNATWSFANSTWDLVATSGNPPGRSIGKMVYSGATAQLLLFGGLNSTGLTDTWVLNGSNWTEVSPTASVSSPAVDTGSNVELNVTPPMFAPTENVTLSGALATSCTRASLLTFSCQTSIAGSLKTTVRIVDASGFLSVASVLVTVNPLPRVTAFTANRSSVPVTSSLELVVALAGGTGPFSYSYGNLPPGCVSANSGRLLCEPSAAGSFQPTVTVLDLDGNRANASVSILVTPSVQGPHGPPGRVASVASWLYPGVTGGVAIGTLVVVVIARRTRMKSDAKELFREMDAIVRGREPPM